MKLLVISHKETWADSASPSGYATIGGFPFQMAALSELFDQTQVMVPIRTSPPPEGRTALVGHQLRVFPLREPAGMGFRRKLTILGWLPRHLPLLWQTVRAADAVHTPIPGDIGTLGLLVALLQRKRLFVRHCSRWGVPTSSVDRFLHWLLAKIASNKNVVWATGGGTEPPSLHNKHIQWIFATSLRRAELDQLTIAKPWHPGQTLRLVTVGSLRPAKNTAAIITALPAILQTHPNTRLDIVGDGPCFQALTELTQENQLTDRVTFHGNISHNEVLALLAEAHLFVFPSFFEGFPKALLEAMASGLPVMASPVSVIPHLVGQGCGLLLEDTNPNAVANAVNQITSDPDAMQSMGTVARRVAAEYTLERWRDQIKDRLESAWGLPLRSDGLEIK